MCIYVKAHTLPGLCLVNSELSFLLCSVFEHLFQPSAFVCMCVCVVPTERAIGEATGAPAMECCACGTAKYRLTFYGNWSEKVHPKDYPSEFNRTFTNAFMYTVENTL